MNLDDMKGPWQGQDQTMGSEPSADQLLAAVAGASAELDRRVRRRDRIEIIVAAVVSLIFLPLLWSPSWVTRAGVLLYMGGSVSTWVMLRRARRSGKAEDPAAPLVEVIRSQRTKVGAQIRLLESVLWWYLAPLAAGVVLIFAGTAGISRATGVYAAAVGALCGLIHHWNKRAVQRELCPRHAELTRLLEEAEGT